MKNNKLFSRLLQVNLWEFSIEDWSIFLSAFSAATRSECIKPSSLIMINTSSLVLGNDIMASSVSEKKQVHFLLSLRLCHFLVTELGYPTLVVFIHFLRRMKGKFWRVDPTIIESSSSEAAQATNTFIHQQRRRSKKAPRSPLLEITSAQLLSEEIHHLTCQISTFVSFLF